MHFYVDESGHTGTNLFDPKQPRLYYGVLRSNKDIDKEGKAILKKIKSQLEVDRLHASELGLPKLGRAVPLLMELQELCGLGFDMYRVEKADHAVISFFDQVFDAGINPAVPWSGYWTPLRYILLMKVAALFDESLLKAAWNARIDPNDETSTPVFLEVCKILRSRVNFLPDARSRQIVRDTLDWAINRPDEISYNCASDEQVLNIAPNMIGFQFVMSGIANRIKSRSGASRIIVDKQSQFNHSQKSLAEVYSQMRNIPFYLGPGMPQMDLKNMPDSPIEFRASRKCPGLEVTDVYLCIFKSLFEKQRIPKQFDPIIASQLEIGLFDQVSLEGIVSRWMSFFANLPEPSSEQLEKAHKLVAEQEKRRQIAMGKS